MTTCYLCGKPIDEPPSGDHAVPRTLLDKAKPKIKGFSYGGRLRTHPKCNNHFGDETYVRKALTLLSAYNNPNIRLERTLPNDPSIRIWGLNSESIPGFMKRDLAFFGIHDVRKEKVRDILDPGYFKDKPSVDPIKRPLFTALAVLGKSAAALLVKRKLPKLPHDWNIIAIPYTCNVVDLELSTIFDDLHIFGPGVSVGIKESGPNVWHIAYGAKTVFVFFFFILRNDLSVTDMIRDKFQDAQCFQFRGASLMELIGYDWKIL